MSTGGSLRVLAWPGMPAAAALKTAGTRVGTAVEVVVVSSNERLETAMAAGPPFDVVFPSDYLVERLRAAGRLRPFAAGALPLERVAAWAVAAPYDPGCRHSVPFAYGTTGILRGPRAAAATSWGWLLDPPPGVAVGMLDEVREVVGAALLAAGRSPNDTSDTALGAARDLLLAQRDRVLRYDSDDFCGPVVRAEVAAHQAWSGPAAHAVRSVPGLSYVVPDEGAVLWTTTAAVPVDAPDPERSVGLVRALMDPGLAAMTTERHGYATPNRAARDRLPPALRDDAVLFPDASTRARCRVLADLGPAEARVIAVWDAVVAAA